MDENKASLYLVAIVGVVAAVGILILLMGSGVGDSSVDISGQATGTPAGMFCCASVQWSDGTTHCVSYSTKPCIKTN